MKYQLHLYWNGKCVLEARTTSAIAYSTIKEFMRGNFAGPIVVPVPHLESISQMEETGIIGGEYGDGTGHGAFKVVRLEDAK